MRVIVTRESIRSFACLCLLACVRVRFAVSLCVVCRTSLIRHLHDGPTVL